MTPPLQLSEHVGIDDVESLVEAMATAPSAALDLARCTHLHTAVVQLLMVAARPIVAWPTDPGLAAWLRAALDPTAPFTLPRQEDVS
jgi:hypothetical protein